jgi:hypothetical protein
MLTNLKTTDFLNNEIGKLGTSPKFELPEDFKKVWSPTGLSLEEINRRKEAVRTLQKEINQFDAATNVYMNGSTTGSSTMVSVPQNKKYYVTAITLSAFNVKATWSSAVGARCGLEIYSQGGTAITSLGRISLIHTSGNESIALDFTNPILVDELQTIRINFTSDTEGIATATVSGWIEDKDILI